MVCALCRETRLRACTTCSRTRTSRTRRARIGDLSLVPHGPSQGRQAQGNKPSLYSLSPLFCFSPSPMIPYHLVSLDACIPLILYHITSSSGLDLAVVLLRAPSCIPDNTQFIHIVCHPRGPLGARQSLRMRCIAYRRSAFTPVG